MNKTVAVFRKSMFGTQCIIVSFLFILSAGCADNGKENEPTEIPFTEYSLTGTDCRWANLDYNGNVIVINSKTEIEKYLVCTNDSYPDVDVANKTLLLVHGRATSGVGQITYSFYHHYANQYTLNVNVSLGFTTVAQPWSIGIVVSKLPSDVKIELNIQSSYYD
jgi:hypothetical protein